ncbi:DUF1684 domain-containing protein [Sinomicrobium weinanense]|uniref:DUF1684 domain-containing protein n=1 Tax=Sinomicrobium weinanense TaxID=2842200 RepID=A0A926JRY8_9FLAO|nr:DUF1684 domain-containing protein [Sinomicrobium weinanense]MBC9796214.1 DUF1684 domain-containing protein [Sinomicrobium weinanense]MBU3123493.1 DUF1684 domain-containing protein [Sinomicrobium weinanense]
MKTTLVTLAFLVFLTGCKGDKRYRDTEHTITADSTSAVGSIELFQQELNEEFRNPETSPLKDRDRKHFRGLEFFPIDTTLRVKAKLERTPEELPFFMPTTTDRETEEVRYGILYFRIGGKEYRLNVYQSQELITREGFEDYLFLPFSDATNGEETYGGGRYMDLRIPEGDEIVLDFNKAYNPYCAYNKKYSCPIVPKENTLSVPVRAGVKAFEGQ